jgi:hypothetical protein
LTVGNDFDVVRDLVISGPGEDSMATRVPKSYQATIAQPGSGPAFPTGPGPFTHKDIVFQVPAGKTWLVIKMLFRTVSTKGPVTSFLIEKASGGGAQHAVLVDWGQNPTTAVNSPSYDWTLPQNLVLEDQEIIRQVLVLPKGSSFTVQYEMSVLEITP